MTLQLWFTYHKASHQLHHNIRRVHNKITSALLNRSYFCHQASIRTSRSLFHQQPHPYLKQLDSFGRPGMVMTSPVKATIKPAPNFGTTSRIVISKFQELQGVWLSSLYCVWPYKLATYPNHFHDLGNLCLGFLLKVYLRTAINSVTIFSIFFNRRLLSYKRVY